MKLATTDWDEPNTASLFGAATHYPVFIFWGIMKAFNGKIFAMHLVWVYCWTWIIVTNMSFRDQLAPWMMLNDKKADENSILGMLVVVHTLNYTSFLETVIVLPLSIMSGYYY